MSQLLDTLASYVPWMLAHRFAADPTPLTGPLYDQNQAVVLFADISGFTKLAEELAKQGPSGAEELTNILNTYFGSLIDLISGHGGDTVKFAGDGLYAIWPTVAHGEDLSILAYRAAQCSLVVQERFHNYEVSAGVSLSMRIGIGTGEVLTAVVGGVLKRWEFLLAGDPVAQMNIASEIAQPGEVILSPQTWTLVETAVMGSPVQQGNFRLEAVTSNVMPRLLAPVNLEAAAEEALRGFVAGAILSKLNAGQVKWLAENRRITVLFLNIHGLDMPGEIERLQSIMQAMQVTLYHYEGSVRQFIVDDKGTVFIAAFGVPPLTHEDDPVRGVQAALAMQSKLKDMGLDSSIGIASGLTFCGPVGNQLRREYAMVGQTVYLAARLMAAASANTVLCDEATYLSTRAHLKFATLQPIRVKNRSRPVNIYAPQGKVQLDSSRRPLIGRLGERTLLEDHLERLENGQSSVVVIQGEAGIGKSHLVADLITKAAARRIGVLIGEANAIERTTLYHGWRDIYSQMFDMDNFTQTRSRSLAIMARLAADPELSRLAPLLNALLPLEIPENEFTEPMTGQSRAENTRSLLLRLLEIHNKNTPHLIILEDAHWLDSASWALAQSVNEHIHPHLLVIVMRPLRPHPSELDQLIAHPLARTITLKPLNDEETKALICQRLEVTSVPEAVTDLIRQKAQGNPFFSEQLVYTLRDSEYLYIEDGECHLGVEEIPDVHVPDTVQGVITSRIDRLPPPQQLTLKVASAIGQEFLFRTLHDIYPIQSERMHLREYLEALQQRDLIEVEVPDPDLAYQFKHNITQEVAYNLMLFAQRRELHKTIARWYERNFIYDLSPFYSFLAHHWKMAEVPANAVDYLERAAQHALRSGAYREVIDFLHEAAETDTDTKLTRQVRWSGYVGEAYWGMGNLRGSRDQAEESLELLGWTIPASRRQLIVEVFKLVIQRYLRRLWSRRSTPAYNRGILLQVVRAFHRLQEVFYFSNERLRTFYTGLQSWHLAEIIGQATHEQASIYANVAVGLGILKRHHQAKELIESANSIATELSQPQTTALVASRAGLYYGTAGQWQKAREVFEQAIRLYDQLGDKRGLGDSLNGLGFIEYLQGNFRRSAHLFDELYETVANSNNREHLAWAMNGRGSTALAFGRTDEAVHSLETAQQLLEQTIDRLGLFNCMGLLATAYLRRNSVDEAMRLAAKVTDYISAVYPISYTAFAGYTGPPEIFLLLWERTGVHMYAKYARRALRQLQRFAHVFPAGRPRLNLLWGFYQYMSKKPNSAQQRWLHTIELAEDLRMPYEVGRAHYMLASLMPTQSPHFDQAITIFKELGATYDLEQTLSLKR